MSSLAEPTARPLTEVRPVEERERLGSVDVLRGMAVLGILAMNIVAFALPMTAYVDPMNPAVNEYGGEFRGLNAAAWLLAHVLFDSKMMAIFSMLFGAGLVLMGSRAAAGGGDRRGRFAGIYYRRILWLLAIGLLHAYALWFGDILVTYAICGLVLYPLRNLRPRVLIPAGLAVLLIGIGMNVVAGGWMHFMRSEAQEAQAVIAEGGTPGETQAQMLEVWQVMEPEIIPGPEQVAEQVNAFRAVPDVFIENAHAAFVFQTQYLLLWGIWRVVGLMLLGMGLMKLGVFAATCSDRFYGTLAAMGYGIGLPLVLWGAWDQYRHEFDLVHGFLLGMQYNYVGSVFVALGHTAAVMLICRRGLFAGVTRRLAAVGRMALSNYLAQSLICTAIFYGWGLGLFGSFERATLYLFVLGVWALELAWSRWWLARFRFGPAEWLWRSLTYWRPQPMRRAAAVQSVAA